MTRLTASSRRQSSANKPTCTGRFWSCPHPGCHAADDTAWTRAGAWVQQWRHQRTHR